MQWIPYDCFEVNKQFCKEELFKLVIDGKYLWQIVEIHKVDRMITPQEKIACFVNAFQTVVDGVTVYSDKNKEVGADESNPLLVFLTLKSLPKQLCSTIK